MSRDYANKNRRKPRGESRFVLAGIFAVVCLIGAIIYAFHVHEQTVAVWMNHVKTLMSRKNNSSVKTPLPSAVAENDEIKFDFYTELPNMQVNLPARTETKPFSISVHKQTLPPVNLAGKIDESIQAVMAEQVKKPPLQFIVEIGEFKDRLNASQLRLSLLLAGIETEVIKTEQQTYRVQLGPYGSERQAKSSQRRLNNKGFESTVKKLD
ncbi:MAG TPA: SPOR domain-containing protein [Gammaproteobacteria bacterium]|nr:SPOR domain-containing protein [Gammaproteobacteria bacterium]